MLKVKIGPYTNNAQVLLDGVDIASKLRVACIEFDPMRACEQVQVRLTVYAEAEVSVLPENITVNVIDQELAQELEKPYCCGGDSCECEGKTIREYLTSRASRKKKYLG